MGARRVAIVHYWLVNMRGGEKVVESLCRLLPDADIFTLFYDPDKVSSTIRSHTVTASFLNPLRRAYRSLLPLMPFALEQFDLRGYDLVISSESGPAKGVLAPSGATHICYCHTPMRYLWDLYPAYLHEWTGSRLKRIAMSPLASYLRLWDYASAARVDRFVANSGNVKRRIRRAFRRPARVIYPPVQVESFFHKAPEDYYLMVGEFVAYKRFATAVEAFSLSGRRLRIVGDGPEYRRLRRMARDNIEFCGRVGEGELRELYARCRAFVVPGEEDFGLTPVEALASGKAVVALGRGGTLESVPARDPAAGFFYAEPLSSELNGALDRFENVESRVDAGRLQRYAARFSEQRFHREMEEILSGQRAGRILRASTH